MSVAFAIGQRVWGEVEPGFVALKESVEFIDHKVEEVGIVVACNAAQVGAQEDIGQVNDFAVGGYRFGVKGFDACGDVAFF